MTVNARRALSLALAVAAVILAAVVLAAKPADTIILLAWAAICTAAAVIVLNL